MKVFVTILLLFSHVYSHAQYFEEDFLNVDNIPSVEMAELTVENLQGVWKKSNKRRYDLSGDEMYETVVEHNHIYIEGDKIWEFEYPSQMYSVSTYIIEDSLIKITSSKYLMTSVPRHALFKLGTSGICNYGVTSDKKYLCFGANNYYKDTLDINVINKLKSGEFNSDCLVGKWKLKTFYDSGYDGNGDVAYIYPWKLPTYLNILKTNVHWFYATNKIYFKIDGVLRPFTIEEIHINDWYSELIITPYKWYKETEKDPEYNEAFIGVHTSTVRYMINDPDDRWRNQ